MPQGGKVQLAGNDRELLPAQPVEVPADVTKSEQPHHQSGLCTWQPELPKSVLRRAGTGATAP